MGVECCECAATLDSFDCPQIFSPQSHLVLTDDVGNPVEISLDFTVKVYSVRLDGSMVPIAKIFFSPANVVILLARASLSNGETALSFGFGRDGSNVKFIHLAFRLDPAEKYDLGLRLSMTATNLTACRDKGRVKYCCPEAKFIYDRKIENFSAPLQCV